MRARDVAQSNRLRHSGEGGEFLNIIFVRAARFGVRNVGEPSRIYFDLARPLMPKRKSFVGSPLLITHWDPDVYPNRPLPLIPELVIRAVC
jgi:hypothetical protein